MRPTSPGSADPTRARLSTTLAAFCVTLLVLPAAAAAPRVSLLPETPSPPTAAPALGCEAGCTPAKAPRAPGDKGRPRRFTVSLEALGGFFGLCHVDRAFVEQSISLGFAPAFEIRVHRFVDLGVEWLFLWMKSVVAERPRLVMSPQLRARLGFDLGRRFSLFLILAAGLTVWPQDDAERALDPALTPTRWGFSLRALAGTAWAVSARWSLTLSAGYFAASSFGAGLTATWDGMQVSLGTRVCF